MLKISVEVQLNLLRIVEYVKIIAFPKNFVKYSNKIASGSKYGKCIALVIVPVLWVAFNYVNERAKKRGLECSLVVQMMCPCRSRFGTKADTVIISQNGEFAFALSNIPL